MSLLLDSILFIKSKEIQIERVPVSLSHYHKQIKAFIELINAKG